MYATIREISSLNWIDGQWVNSANTKTSYNPSTGEAIGEYADAGVEDAAIAVNKAETAFQLSNWKKDHTLRSNALNSMAGRLERNHQSLVYSLCTESGKIAGEAAMEVYSAITCLRYWAGKTFITGRAAVHEPGTRSALTREPIGVAGIIVPYNAPVALSIRSLAPALAAGCSVVIKLPGLTAQTNAKLSSIIAEVAEIPAGIINMLTESGDAVSKYLVKAPGVKAISFTGSSRTGRIIADEAASGLKRMVLELGGKTPMIVFDDVNLDAAIPVLTKAITLFSGQFCMAGSRILVQRGIADVVKARLSASLSGIKAGDGLQPETEIGSMIHKEAVRKTNQLVEDAIAAGTEILVRGGPITAGPLAAGAYYLPTLLETDDSSLPIVQEEIFGPVATLQVFDTEEEAIRLANETDYGLAASIWTQDSGKPWRVAEKLQAGTIWINTYARIFPQMEEGGYKQSGLGRLNGEAGLDAFMEYKHIVFNTGESAP